MALCVRLKYQHFVVAEIVVTRCYHLLARLEAFEDFVELRVLTADADLALCRLAAFRRHYIYPFSTGLLVECTARDEDGVFRLTELEIEVVGLTCADVCRLLLAETEVGLELSAAHFRIYLADDSVICLVLTFEGRRKTGIHSIYLVFIYLSFNLVAFLCIDLSDLRTASD